MEDARCREIKREVARVDLAEAVANVLRHELRWRSYDLVNGGCACGGRMLAYKGFEFFEVAWLKVVVVHD